jgi:aminomethyltransferase
MPAPCPPGWARGTRCGSRPVCRGPGITPLQAGLGWVVGWGKGAFPGRQALEAERDRGPHRLLRGILLDGRRPPRAGQAILREGEAVGEVTSGNFSPVLERGIALGFVPPELEPGTQVAVDLRGTEAPGRIVETPFVELGRAA